MQYQDQTTLPHPHRAAAHRRPPTRMRWAAAGGLSLLTLVVGGAGATLAGIAPAGAATHHAVVVKHENNAKLGTILVTSSGFTLYHLTTDKPNHPTCTGSCATIWPPLTIAHQEKKVTGGTGVTGLSAVKLSDGKWQVTYHGMPLYRFSGDTAAGETNGQGIGGVWFAVTAPKTAAAAHHTTTSHPATTSGGGGGGGGY
jgi:predicted lipoprotein with Yx(FWY)xxD motif